MSGSGAPQAEDHFHQLVLPIAFHARYAEDLSRADGKGDPIDHALAKAVQTHGVAYAQTHFPGLRKALVELFGVIRAYHHRRKLALRDVGDMNAGHHLAPAHYAYAVAEFHDLAQFVGIKMTV